MTSGLLIKQTHAQMTGVEILQNYKSISKCRISGRVLSIEKTLSYKDVDNYEIIIQDSDLGYNDYSFLNAFYKSRDVNIDSDFIIFNNSTLEIGKNIDYIVDRESYSPLLYGPKDQNREKIVFCRDNSLTKAQVDTKLQMAIVYDSKNSDNIPDEPDMEVGIDSNKVTMQMGKEIVDNGNFDLYFGVGVGVLFVILLVFVLISRKNK